jgi:hypothetical protein
MLGGVALLVWGGVPVGRDGMVRWAARCTDR